MIIEFKILSKPWTLRVLPKSKYKKKHGIDSIGITDANKRRIDISPFGTDKETIIHELVHAYFAELCLHSTDLDNDNLEEVFAELLSKRGLELLKLADKLYKKITE